METIKKALAFRIWPTTICVAIVYAAVIVSVLVTDELPEVPSHSRQQGLNLTKAYADLHQVCSHNSKLLGDHLAHVLDRLLHVLTPTTLMQMTSLTPSSSTASAT